MNSSALVNHLDSQGMPYPLKGLAELRTMAPAVDRFQQLGVGGLWIMRRPTLNGAHPTSAPLLVGQLDSTKLMTFERFNERLDSGPLANWQQDGPGQRTLVFAGKTIRLDLVFSANPFALAEKMRGDLVSESHGEAFADIALASLSDALPNHSWSANIY